MFRYLVIPALAFCGVAGADAFFISGPVSFNCSDDELEFRLADVPADGGIAYVIRDAGGVVLETGNLTWGLEIPEYVYASVGVEETDAGPFYVTAFGLWNHSVKAERFVYDACFVVPVTGDCEGVHIPPSYDVAKPWNGSAIDETLAMTCGVPYVAVFWFTAGRAELIADGAFYASYSQYGEGDFAGDGVTLFQSAGLGIEPHPSLEAYISTPIYWGGPNTINGFETVFGGVCYDIYTHIEQYWNGTVMVDYEVPPEVYVNPVGSPCDPPPCNVCDIFADCFDATIDCGQWGKEGVWDQPEIDHWLETLAAVLALQGWDQAEIDLVLQYLVGAQTVGGDPWLQSDIDALLLAAAVADAWDVAAVTAFLDAVDSVVSRLSGAAGAFAAADAALGSDLDAVADRVEAIQAALTDAGVAGSGAVPGGSGGLDVGGSPLSFTYSVPGAAMAPVAVVFPLPFGGSFDFLIPIDPRGWPSDGAFYSALNGIRAFLRAVGGSLVIWSFIGRVWTVLRNY